MSAANLNVVEDLIYSGLLAPREETMNASTFADAVEIITLLAEQSCGCNFETDSEGKTIGRECLRCRALAWLREATK